MKIKFKIKSEGDLTLSVRIIEQNNIFIEKIVNIGKNHLFQISSINIFEITYNEIFLKGNWDYESEKSRKAFISFKNKEGLKKFILFLKYLGNKEKNIRFSKNTYLNLRDFNVRKIEHKK